MVLTNRTSHSLERVYPFGGGDEDKIRCPSKKGKFTIRSFYESLSMKNASPFLWNSIWKTNAPHKGNLLCLDCFLGEDSYTRQPKEMLNHCRASMLHVQKEWKVC